MKKKILPLLLIFMISLPPFNSSFAYTGGLLDGKTLQRGPNIGTSTNWTNIYTDNNESTYSDIYPSGGNDTIYYIFPAPVTISDYKLKGGANVSNLTINFYNGTPGTLLKTISNPNISGTKTDIVDVANVRTVTIENATGSNINYIYEFDVFAPTLKTDVTNVDVTGITATSANATWVNPTGYNGVTYLGAKVYVDGVLKTTLSSSDTTYALTGLNDNTSYNLKVTALYSDSTETTGVVKPFTTPPLVKTNVSNVSIDTITTNSATVSWLNPTGYSGVTYNGAKIYINNIYHHTSLPGETSYTFTNLSPNTNYTFKIAASYSDASETVGIIDSLKTSLSASDHVLITARIKGGGLNLIYNPSVSNDGDFGVITTDGATQEVFSNIGSITVTDHQGTGGGWNLTVQASPFQEVGGLGYSIPMGSLTLSGIQAVSQGISFVKTDDSIIDSNSPVSLASANTNEGMGNTDITFPNQGYKLLLDTSLPLVDSSNLTGMDNSTPYEAIVTWSVSTGP